MSGSMPIHPEDEERLAARMASELEGLTMTTPVLPSEGFADRVMAAIADEPLPQPTRAFRRALGAGRVGAAIAAVRDAARLITIPRVPLAVRVQAFALVLVVALGSLGVVGGAAVGASALLRGTTPPQPSPSVPMPSPLPSPSPSPTVSPSPTNSADPTDTPEPTETPEPTDDHTAGPTGTDDHGGGSGSGSGSGSSGSGSGKESGGSGSDSSGSGGGETPKPTGTDDHGGSADG